ncbi:hypothetical protein SHKM778_15610 [Streptomyces sp. KM77-8]|uniref:Uncharacterized protein n=1 Tax=Streptomyces haneummycinicus TaxID=3074435 RepID=A0AAT9HCS6_9ACTN
MRVGLAFDDRGHARVHAGLAYDGAAEEGDPPLLLGGQPGGGTRGDRVDEAELADVVHQGGVLQHGQFGFAQSEVPAHRLAECGDPAGVSGRGAAGDLGGPREGGDGLPVGGAHGGVPPVGELGEQQRYGEDGQRPQSDDRDAERHHRARGDDGGPDAGQGPQFVAQGRQEGPSGAGVGERGGEDGVAQGGEGQQGEQQDRVGGAAPAVEGAPVVQRLEAQGDEADGQHPARRRVEGGAVLASDVRHAAEQGGREHHGDDLGGAVVGGPPRDLAEQRVRQ